MEKVRRRRSLSSTRIMLVGVLKFNDTHYFVSLSEERRERRMRSSTAEVAGTLGPAPFYAMRRKPDLDEQSRVHAQWTRYSSTVGRRTRYHRLHGPVARHLIALCRSPRFSSSSFTAGRKINRDTGGSRQAGGRRAVRCNRELTSVDSEQRDKTHPMNNGSSGGSLYDG